MLKYHDSLLTMGDNRSEKRQSVSNDEKKPSSEVMRSKKFSLMQDASAVYAPHQLAHMHSKLLGCSLLAVGAWLLMDDNAGRYVDQLGGSPTGADRPLIISYSQITDSTLSATLAYLFIAFGCVIIIIAFIGCCGAVRENQCMLGAFFVSLFVVFAVLLGVGIWAFVARHDVNARTGTLEQLTKQMLRDAVATYDSDTESAKFMNTVQKRFRCCGADYAADDYIKNGISQIPCDMAYQLRPCLPVYFNYVKNHFENFMRDRLVVVGSIAIGIAVCMVLGMTGVLLLCCAVKERRWNTNA